MTFNLQNALPFETGAEKVAAMEYMHDTFLSGLPQFTVTAHPGGALYKRSYTRSCTNWLTGQPYLEYFYSNWSSSTNPTRLYVYGDSTYTTTPGDLGTDTTYGINSSVFSDFEGAQMRFWYSDQSNAALVTAGKKVFWFDFGYTQNAFWTEGLPWDGSLREDPLYFPLMGTEKAASIGGFFAGSSRASTFPIIPFYTHISDKLEDDKPILMQDMVMGSPSGSSTVYPGTTSRVLFNASGNDVLFYVPSNPSPADADRSYCRNDNVNCDLVLSNARYYLFTAEGLNRLGLALDFGPTEPVLG